MDAGSLPAIAPTHLVPQRVTAEPRAVVEPVLQGELLQRDPPVTNPEPPRGQTYRYEPGSRHAQPGFRDRYTNDQSTARRAVAAYQETATSESPARGSRLDLFA